MIDKLDVALPERARFTPKFTEFYRRSYALEFSSRVHRNSAASGYRFTSDMRPMGMPVLLRQNFVRSKQGGHKIEIFEAGEKSLAEMEGLVEEIYNVDGARARMLRFDAAADVEGVPVDWFRVNAHVLHKAITRDIGTERLYQDVYSRAGETCYYGKKPNQMRIYDKGGERWMRLGAERRKLSKAVRWTDEQMTALYIDRYGCHPSWKITRVERQFGGYDPQRFLGDRCECGGDENCPQCKGIGKVSARVQDLRKLPFFDPFERLHLPEQSDVATGDHGKVEWRDHVAACDERIKRMGLAGFRRWLRGEMDPHNFSRHWKKLEPFLSFEQGRVTKETIRKSFIHSVNRQLLAA